MRLRWLFLSLFVLSVLVVPALAQDGNSVTDDEVNEVAKKLYCPVCENIPLEYCGTAACDDWRYEIRLQLEAGLSEQEIVEDFIARFGDRVVGVPQDPLLAAISMVVPILMIGASLLAVLFLGVRWVRNRPEPTAVAAEPTADASPYRDILERDLAG